MGSPRTSALISWLHDCLDAERSNRGIVNVAGAGVKRRRFLEGRDMALGGGTGWVDLAPELDVSPARAYPALAKAGNWKFPRRRRA